MKKIVIISFYAILLSAGLFAAKGLQWNHYRNNPHYKIEYKEIVVPITEASIKLPDTEYYYYENTYILTQCDDFPKLKNIVVKKVRMPNIGYFYYRKK